jgi:hypothetical protein
VGVGVALCGGNTGLVVTFLLNVVQCVYYGLDPPLLFGFIPKPVSTPAPTTQPSGFPVDLGVHPIAMIAGTMWVTLLVALIWYALSLAVLAIAMSAERSRGQRTSASLE